MAPASQSNLLGAARAWMQRTKATAVLAIAPLAVVALAPVAKGQVTLGPVGAPNVDSGSGDLLSSNLGPVFNSAGGTGGITFGSNVTLELDKDSPFSSFSITYSGSSSSGFLAPGPLAVSYTFGSTGADFFPMALTLYGPGGASLGTQSFGTSTSGSGNYILATGSNITGYSFTLAGIGGFDAPATVQITMNQGAGQGITLTPAIPVPEPATTAGIAGLFALGLACWRRRWSRLARAG